MLEKDVIVTTKYGAMPTFAVCPDGPGQYPGIIFYMDAPGIREELRNMARRIARRGYFCLLPDMYYRLGHLRFDVHRRDDSMMPAIPTSMDRLTNRKVVQHSGRPQRAAAHPWRIEAPVGAAGRQAPGQGIPRHRARLRLPRAGDLQHAGRRGDLGQNVPDVGPHAEIAASIGMGFALPNPFYNF